MSDEIVAALMRQVSELADAVGAMRAENSAAHADVRAGQERIAAELHRLNGSVAAHEQRIHAIENAAMAAASHAMGVADERARWLRWGRWGWALVRPRIGTWATVAAGAGIASWLLSN